MPSDKEIKLSVEEWKELNKSRNYIQDEMCSVDAGNCEIERLIIKHRKDQDQKTRQEERQGFFNYLKSHIGKTILHVVEGDFNDVVWTKELKKEA